MKFSHGAKILGMIVWVSLCRTEPFAPAAEGIHKGPSKVFEHSSYRILYQLTGHRREPETPPNSAESFEQIIYKVSLLDSHEDFGPMETGWSEIRFLDSDRYILASDLVAQDQLLPQREYYAYLWIPAEKLGNIRDVQLKVLSAQEVPAAHRRAQVRRRMLGENPAVTMPASVRKTPGSIQAAALPPAGQGGLNRKETLSIIDQNIQKIQAILGRSSDPAHEAKENDAPLLTETSGEENQSPESMDSDEARLTNEDLAQFLKELDENQPTLDNSNNLPDEE